MERVLVTGASGFIGSFIVSEGLDRGLEVWAGVRGSSSRAYLQDGRIRFAQLNLGDKTRLKPQLEALRAEMGDTPGTMWCMPPVPPSACVWRTSTAPTRMARPI